MDSDRGGCTARATSSIFARLKLERAEFRLDVDLALPGCGVSALFGHSGCGKTTILRLIAGLERAPGCRIVIGDEIWQDDERRIFVPAHRRAIGYVFQEASLFPHLSARANLEFGLRRATASREAPGIDAIADLLGITHLLDRMPDALSGGERQRVAIARALLTAPRLLLMDEPLSALDLRLKREILPYLERLHRELSIPVIYVSHAPDEVARLADHLVLLDGGRVLASGALNDVLSRLDLASAFSDDAGVVIDATVGAQEADDLTRLDFSGGNIYVSRRSEPLGTSLRCRILARDVSVALVPSTQSSILNCVDAIVIDLAPTDTPGHVLVRLDCGGAPLLARITKRSALRLELKAGLALRAQIKSVALLG